MKAKDLPDRYCLIYTANTALNLTGALETDIFCKKHCNKEKNKERDCTLKTLIKACMITFKPVMVKVRRTGSGSF